MLWKPFSIFHTKKSSTVQHMGLLLGHSLSCACTARARLWKPTCPRCHMQTAPRNQTLLDVLLSSAPQKEKQRKAIKVECCVFCESQSNVCLRSQGGTYSGLQSRQALFDPWKERGKPSCSKPTSLWGESTFSQQYFSFYHCSHLQLSRGCDASVTPMIDGQEVMRHCHSLIVCV